MTISRIVALWLDVLGLSIVRVVGELVLALVEAVGRSGADRTWTAKLASPCQMTASPDDR